MTRPRHVTLSVGARPSRRARCLAFGGLRHLQDCCLTSRLAKLANADEHIGSLRFARRGLKTAAFDAKVEVLHRLDELRSGEWFVITGFATRHIVLIARVALP